ncbi:MAG TPA: hypothetical protein P5254_14425 [Aquihabitans sp.]|nr:hypothetical protein [Aquihabitans sp.]
MAALAGPLYAAAALLALAGVGKLTRPAATRVALRQAGLPSSAPAARALGAVEIAIGVAAIVVGGPLLAAATAASYAGFAWFAHRLDRASRGTADCGCFGDRSAPVGPIHVGVNLAVTAVLVAAVAWPVDGIAATLDGADWGGVPFVGLTLLLTWMLSVSLTSLPAALAAAKQAASGAAAASSATGGPA